MTSVAVESQVKAAVVEKTRPQLAQFSDVEYICDITFPAGSESLIRQASSVSLQLHDHANYLGRSVILLSLLDNSGRTITQLKSVVNLRAIGNVVFATRTLPQYRQISSPDVVVRRVSISDVSRQAFGSVDRVVNREVVSTISEGSAPTQLSVREVPDIRRGGAVMVDYRKSGIQVKVPAEALADGRVGDRVKVRLKLGSQKIMEGQLVDSTTVIVQTAN